MAENFETVVAGRQLLIETGKIAQLADGSALIRYGDTVVLGTAVSSHAPREGIDFFPLTVDFEEKMYAAGKIPGGFIKRESRPSEQAILAARLTDRPIRPLFPKAYRNDVQVMLTVLSADQENDPSILGIIAASVALSISDIPFFGPVAAVKVGYINDEFVLNPTMPQMAYSRLDLTVAGTSDAVMMVEAGVQELPEEVVLQGIQFAHQSMQPIIELQRQMMESIGKPKRAYTEVELPGDARAAVVKFLDGRLAAAVNSPDKHTREDATNTLKREAIEKLSESFEPVVVGKIFDSLHKTEVRSAILDRGVRPDGRGTKDIRALSAEVGLLPRTHGSGMFTRGQTQVLSVATLGSASERQVIDGIGLDISKRWMHHYNFPPYSTGEVRPLRGASRRDIGHGNLAERALSAVIPDIQEFPYTIRVVSEVVSSNGSTSMASVCGSTLALMDAGVPIKAAVAGIAMGLVMGDGGKYTVLTDIQGLEDNLGDMDFKVAGTSDGVTALQMDIKVKGITPEIMGKALAQAREARAIILEVMANTIEEVRPEMSPYAPRMTKIQINPDKIRDVIGPGGKMIRKIIEETKCTIDVEDDGTVIVGSTSAENAGKAIKMIQRLTREVEVGETYTGTVTRILPFGAFIELIPGKEGLVHISELEHYRVARVEDVVNVGDEVTVVVSEIDRQGRVNLSRKALLPRPADAPASEGGVPTYTPRPGGPMGVRPGGDRPRRPERRDFGGPDGPRRPMDDKR
ncbi:MAG TPA: polyribonucleotide nucleotidyltransferase [Chloroflexota bacterium]|nr:polyribonucleotide nucleotidyltransferase [Chloroflexota bacterium]